jgi:hypothetical protein
MQNLASFAMLKYSIRAEASTRFLRNSLILSEKITSQEAYDYAMVIEIITARNFAEGGSEMHLCSFCFSKSTNRGRKSSYPCLADGCNGTAIKVNRHTKTVATQLLKMGYRVLSATVRIAPTANFVYTESIYVCITFSKPYPPLCFPELPLCYIHTPADDWQGATLSSYCEVCTPYTMRYDRVREVVSYLEDWCADWTERGLPTILALTDFYL